MTSLDYDGSVDQGHKSDKQSSHQGGDKTVARYTYIKYLRLLGSDIGATARLFI